MQPNDQPGPNQDRNGYFYYQYQNQHFGNQTSTFFVLILALVSLVALLRSEARYRKLLENLLASRGGSAPDCKTAPTTGNGENRPVNLFGLISFFTNQE